MSDIIRPPFPPALDSTIIATARSCHQKVKLEHMDHYKPHEPSVHLHAGGAFASGLEAARRAYWTGVYKTPLWVTDEIGKRIDSWHDISGEAGNRELAEACGLRALLAAYGDFQCPADSAKSAERTAGAFEFYMTRWPLGADGAEPIILANGARGIELSFAHPLPIAHPETGDPLLYVGRLDQAVSYAGASFGEDDKTTSQLGASWPRQWDLRSQFTGYCWGMREAGLPLAGMLVRGVSILKTKYDTAEAITYRPNWMIERWYAQMLKDVERLIAAWKENYYDYNLDHACSEYGGCLFRQVCLAPDPQPWLQQFFQRRRWDPVTRTETVMEEKA